MSHFSLYTVTAPSVEPISLADAKLHLRVDVDTDDDLINAIIKAARQRLEIDARVALITQTLEMRLDCFPVDGDDILLLRPPLQSVTSIKYVDTDGVEQTWSSDDYAADIYSTPARIRPAYGEVYPTARSVNNAVTIRYTAGYGDAATAVPDDLLQALKLLIGHFYENREDVITGTIASKLPNAYKWLVAPHQGFRF